MLAGSDLIMTAVSVALAVSLVRARDTSRGARPGDLKAYGARPGDLEAYNAYLVGLAYQNAVTKGI